MGLVVNEQKPHVLDVRYGVEFLGAYLKPRRRYVSRQTLRRMTEKLPSLAAERDAVRLRSRLNSFLGILGHYRSYRLRRRMFFGLRHVYRYGYFLQGMRKYVLYPILKGEAAFYSKNGGDTYLAEISYTYQPSF